MLKKNMMKSKLPQKFLFYTALIVLWQLVFFLGVYVLKVWKPYAVPSPIGVWDKFLSLVAGKSLLIALVVSLKHAAIGFGLSIVVGLCVGLLITKSRYLNENLKPLILGLQTLPSICWVPFAILWFGLQEEAIIFVIIIGSAFSIAISVESAIKNVDPIYIRAAKTMGANEKELYYKIILPASMPSLLAGLKQGWSFAWRALMAGEMMSSTIGLGQVLLMGRDFADINQVMVVMIIIVLLGTIIEKCIFQNLELRIREKMGLERDRS